jgi:hypothetical protein
MPVHDWTRADAGIFHDFHHSWTVEIKRRLNGGLLPSNYYALAEEATDGFGSDVLTPQAEADWYAAKANAIVVHHCSNHRVVAIVEIISPGIKISRKGLWAFVRKAEEALLAGAHLLIVDLFPPGPRDPQGIHREIWGQRSEDTFTLPAGKPLLTVSYIGSARPEAFLEPLAVRDPLPEMPLFLTPDEYIPMPIERTYQAAWEAVPAYWRDALTAGTGS